VSIPEYAFGKGCLAPVYLFSQAAMNIPVIHKYREVNSGKVAVKAFLIKQKMIFDIVK
jgi:hypothetical protein